MARKLRIVSTVELNKVDRSRDSADDMQRVAAPRDRQPKTADESA